MHKNLTKFIFACVLFAAAPAISSAEESDSLFLGFGSLVPAISQPKSSTPKSVTLIYGFSLLKEIKPYVGTGVAYVFTSDAKPGENPARFKTGVAGQAGFKIDLGEQSLFQIDYQYLNIATDQPQKDNSATLQSIGFGLKIQF